MHLQRQAPRSRHRRGSPRSAFRWPAPAAERLNLTSSTGVIHGFPDVTGTYSFKVKVTDSETTPQSVTSGWLSITVSGPVVTGVRPHVGPAFGHTPVRITGSGLSCPRFGPFCRVSVTFGGRPGRVLFASPNLIVAISPRGIGRVDVIVTVGGVHSQAHPADHFTYLLFPFIQQTCLI